MRINIFEKQIHSLFIAWSWDLRVQKKHVLISEEEDDDEDPIIIDYMDRLDAEVGGEVKGRQDLPDQAG